MKKLSFFLAALCIQVAALAQSITLRFDGATNSANAQNFTVDIDGTKYYSFNATATGNTRTRQLDITSLPVGSHTLKVYRNNTNTAVRNGGTDAPVYSNAFQLRTGYDMVIAIRRNGQVTFTEKRNNTNTSTTAQASMTDAKFNTLLNSVKSKWSQSSRYAAVKSAFNTKTNYFTTDQAGQLLMVLTSEKQKLELAKLAYPRITDPQNYMDVTELFNSQANKNSIEQFINSKNPQYSTSTNNTSANNTGYANAPLTTQQFNQLVRTVNNQYQQAGKVAVLRDAFNVTTNYFTTAQIRQLLTMITTETERLELAKLSYARVSDPANFNTLYNLFPAQATRDELDNYTRYGNTGATTPTTTYGQYSNRVAMTESDFSRLQMKVRLHIRQSSVVEDVREAFMNTNNWFSVEQTRSLLSYVTNETERLAIAKMAYHRVTDPTAFAQIADLFAIQANRDDLSNYMRMNRS